MGMLFSHFILITVRENPMTQLNSKNATPPSTIRQSWVVRLFAGSPLEFLPVPLFLMVILLGFISVKALTAQKISDAIENDFQVASAHANAQVQDAIAQTRSCALEKFNRRMGFSEKDDWRRTVWIPCTQQGESLLHENAADLADLRSRLTPIESHWVRLLFPPKKSMEAQNA